VWNLSQAFRGTSKSLVGEYCGNSYKKTCYYFIMGGLWLKLENMDENKTKKFKQ